MATPGYVYALINQSLKGLVKIGKTTKRPDTRAAELSAATGVPTPFHVAYEEEYSDCDLAERTIHALLQDQGFRVNDKREFFEVPLKQVILAFQRVLQDIGGAETVETCAAEGIAATENDLPYRVHCHQMGEVHRLGINVPVDYDEAIEWYIKAADLGSPFEYLTLGTMYIEDLKNKQKGMKYLKMGTKVRDERCWGAMFNAYTDLPCEVADIENGRKCADLYFNSESFNDNIDFLPGEISFRSEFAWSYLYRMKAFQRSGIVSEIDHIDKVKMVLYEYRPLMYKMINQPDDTWDWESVAKLFNSHVSSEHHVSREL